MVRRFELSKTGVEIVLERLTQEYLVGVRVVGSEHPVGESVEAQRIVVRPGYREAQSLGELLQIDQRWTRVDPNRLVVVEQFAGVAGRAGNAEHHALLPGVGINEAIVARRNQLAGRQDFADRQGPE